MAQTSQTETPKTAQWLTVEDVAARLGFAVPAVRRLARLKILAGEKIGKQWRFSPDVIPDQVEKPIRAWDAEPDPVHAALPVLRERLADVLLMVDAVLYRPVPPPSILRELAKQMESLSETCLIIRDMLQER